MRGKFLIAAMVVVATTCFAGVNISAPGNGSTVGSPVHFVASASGATTIASMIVYVDGNQYYLVYSNNLDTYISLGAGSHTAVISAWDNYGNIYSASQNFSVGSTSTGVNISSPANGATVGSPVHFVASAKGNAPIASMILYVDGNQQYLTYSANLDTSVSLGAGTHSVQINSWDNNGTVYVGRETITVGSGGGGGGSSSGTWVNVSSPSNGATVASPLTINANGGSPNGISGWVIYSDDQNVFQSNNNSNSLSASVSLSGGSHTLYVRAWDRSSGQYGTSSRFDVNVSSSSGGGGGGTVTAGTSIYDIQTMGGWDSCTVCAGAGGNGPSASYSMWQWQGDPSLDGKSSRFIVWGGAPYSDVLWWKSLSSIIGNTSAPHHFIYDTHFMVDDSSRVQVLEFDINQFVNGHSLIFGTQCNVLDGNSWDIWDNRNSRWVSTGVYCGAPSAWVWHHVTVEVERGNDGGDWLHYVAITLDGQKHYIDAWYPPAWTDWTGITVNFQMDTDYAGHGYSTWLDKLTFSYW